MKRGPKTEAGRARALANLRPWKPGEAGGGHRPAGESIREKMNEMADWPEADIRAVAESPRASVAERSAANQLLLCLNGGQELERTCNQTAGTPQKTVNMNVSGGLAHAHTVQAAMARLKSDPAAFEAAERLGQVLYDGDGGSTGRN
jgi:hypothetical protein